VGDEANIIFGAGSDPAMAGEIRVTVIATGFDRAVGSQLVQPVTPIIQVPMPAAAAPAAARPDVVPITQPRRPIPTPKAAPPVPRTATPLTDLPDMEIPTFIRRQMD